MTSLELAVATRAQDVEPRRLDELAKAIVEHHAVVQEAARRTLEHALACGDALVEAREMVPEGLWRGWLRENCALEKSTAQMYQRIAKFRDELRLAGVDSIQSARDYLQTYGLRLDPGGSQPHPPEVVEEIRMLAKQGLSQAQIARRVAVGRTGVGRILRGERYRDEPAPIKRGERLGGKPAHRVRITDDMIEGMARWLAVRGQVPLTDKTRSQATEALRVALNYRIKR